LKAVDKVTKTIKPYLESTEFWIFLMAVSALILFFVYWIITKMIERRVE
jgi:p-aminobenzoyl-glutamate transporter AbgT